MKRFISLLFLFSTIIYSQVGINTTSPNAQLDIRSSNQATPANTDGVLIPKVDAFPVTNPTVAQQGMLVYLTTVVGLNQPGFYYWNNPTTAWVALAGAGGSGGTLDQAYDFGGAGLGKTITADAGAVNIAGTDGFQSTGTLSSGATITLAGAGTRMFWNPRKSAFRAGTVTSGGATYWNDINVGSYSTAFGYNALADNDFTTSIGVNTSASGIYSMVFGYGTTANGLAAAAFGAANIANGDLSHTFGVRNTSETYGEIALGIGATTYTPTVTGVSQFRAANATDRLLVVGNAIDANANNDVDAAERSDALIILKNGLTRLPSTTNAMITAADGKAVVTKEYVASLSSGWSLTGNAGTNAATNFLGTTDNVDVIFKRNNIKSGLIRLNNTSFGNNSMPFAMSGSNNVAFGANAARVLGSGSRNTAIGTSSMYYLLSATDNFAGGWQSLYSATSASNNIAIGSNSLYTLINSSGNVAIGNNTLQFVIGSNNSAFGFNALNTLTGGSNNMGIGYNAQVPSLTGNNQLSIGNSIYGLDMGLATSKIGIGLATPTEKLHVEGNVRLSGALMPNNLPGTAGQVLTSAGAGLPPTWAAAGGGGSGWLTTGNTLSGANDGTEFMGTTSADDVYFKRNNVHAGVITEFDTAFGYNALAFNMGVSGFNNTAFGTRALTLLNGTGANNTAVGSGSLQTLGQDQNDNTTLGYNSLSALATGNNNVAIGSNAGLTLTSGNNNIAIGYNAQVPTTTGSNQMRLGNTAITYAGTQVALTITSDKKWKSNIQKSKLGLDFINQLKPVQYTRNNDASQKVEYGLIAQDLEKTLEKNGETNSYMLHKADDGSLGVRYNDLMAPMIKAIQELKEQNEVLNKRIIELEKQVKK